MNGANQLRASLAEALSEMYAAEVPAYDQLVDGVQRINRSVGTGHRDDDRLGGERHGAIRVASFDELSQIARLFAFYGMEAVGYYDLRSSPTPIPVVSTAFRPVAPEDLAASPFRMFTSTLVVDDERFFSAELQQQLRERIAARALLSEELVELIERAELEETVAEPERFVELTVDALRLDRSPIDKAWHDTLDGVSTVASDIAAAPNTHLNHLTPRVLDIEALHELMEAEGLVMIDCIQGPPSWSGPDLLLRQTSFRALDEERAFVGADGREVSSPVRVRFGEVEQRGIALTPHGRARLDEAMAAGEGISNEVGRLDAIRAHLNLHFASTVEALFGNGDIFVQFSVVDGQLHMEPITYEDFLPASAAGIFASNLARPGAEVEDVSVRPAEADLLRVAVGTLHDPYQLYQRQQEDSFTAAQAELDNNAG